MNIVFVISFVCVSFYWVLGFLIFLSVLHVARTAFKYFFPVLFFFLTLFSYLLRKDVHTDAKGAV